MYDSIFPLGNQLLDVEMFPYFDIAHNLLAALDVRHDLYKRNPNINQYPFLSWLSVMLVTFSGSLMANLLLGEPILTPFVSTPHVVVATAMWFTVFYSPLDVGYKVATFMPINLLANIMKEIYRARKVSNGILQVERIFPQAFIVMIIIGAIRGNGAGIFKQLLCIARKFLKSKDESDLYVMPSFSTMACLLAAAFLVLEKNIDWISAYELVYFFVTVFFVYFKLSSTLSNISLIGGSCEPDKPMTDTTERFKKTINEIDAKKKE